MNNYSNFLLITDDESTVSLIKKKLMLLRKSDCLLNCDYGSVNNIFENSDFDIVILHAHAENDEVAINALNYIKNVHKSTEVLLLTDEPEQSFILKYYDLGITDYFSVNSDAYELMIKMINCQKIRQLKNVLKIKNMMLNEYGVYSEYSEILNYSHLKTIFLELIQNNIYKDAIFVILKQQSNSKDLEFELAKSIKKYMRITDIVAKSNNGNFYLILPQVEIEQICNILEKIQQNFEYSNVYFGATKIFSKDIDEVENCANISLEKNIQNQGADVYESLKQDCSTDNKSGKNYKLFNKKYLEISQRIIAPIFSSSFRKYKQEMDDDVVISKYTNNTDASFCLLSDYMKSELKILQEGAKIKLTINHSGLESTENSQYEVSMNKFHEGILDDLLKKLRKEFDQTKHVKHR